MDWPVLAPVPAEDRRRLVAGLGRRAYRRDEVIFHQGDPADTLHLIATGHVSVRVTLPGGEFVIVAILRPANQVLGWLAASHLVEVSRGQILVLNRTELHRRAGHPGQA